MVEELEKWCVHMEKKWRTNLKSHKSRLNLHNQTVLQTYAGAHPFLNIQLNIDSCTYCLNLRYNVVVITDHKKMSTSLAG